jgi:hypothetical protein
VRSRLGRSALPCSHSIKRYSAVAKPRRRNAGTTTTSTTEERKPAWRRACLAYREIREAGGSDQQAHEAAVEAVLSVLPALTQKEASAEAVNAVAYASRYHSEWFWRGVSGE